MEVQIPIKENDISRFVNAVYRTTYFWDVRPELHGITDVEIPADYSDPKIKYQKNNLIVMPANIFLENLFETKYVSHKAFILIDKIPYGIAKFQYQLENLRKLSNIVHNNNIVFFEVNNGEIDVAASREEVANDSGNIAKLESVCEGATNNILEIIREEFSVEFDSLNSYMNAYGGLKDTFSFNHIPKDTIKLEYSYEDIKFEMHGLNFHVKCDKFSNISVFFQEEQDTRTVIRNKKDEQSVRLAGLGCPQSDKIVIADIEYSDIIKKRKIKKLLEQGADHVYLVTCDSAYTSKLQKCANALLLSNLKHDNVTYVAKKRAEGIVSIRNLSLGHGRRGYRIESNAKTDLTLDALENDGKKYVIIPNDDSEKYDFQNSKFVGMVSCLLNNGFCAIKCSKKDYDKVVELDNVVEYEDFISNIEDHLPFTNEQIENSIFSRVNNTILGLRQFAETIECPKLKELLAIYPTGANNNNRRGINVSEEILKKYKHYKVASEKFEKANALEEEVFKRYPLIENYYGYGGTNNILREYVYYINNKYQVEYSNKISIKLT